MRLGNGVVFAVAGSKGGVGKTTTSINLSAVLAEKGYDVVLVEMDLAMANVGDFLEIDVRLEGEDPTLHEVLAGTVSVVDATYDSPCEFDVVPSGASLKGFANANVDAMAGALATLKFAYDIVVIDTGAGVMPSTLLSLALADETILISSPRVASVRDTTKTRDLTRQVGGSVAGVVFVRSGTGRSPGVDRIAEFLAVDLLGHVPEDSSVASAQDVGRPVVDVRPESDAAKAYRALGDSLHERIEALHSTRSATLSADRLDGDGSGFAFIETEERDGGDEVDGDVWEHLDEDETKDDEVDEDETKDDEPDVEADDTGDHVEAERSAEAADAEDGVTDERETEIRAERTVENTVEAADGDESTHAADVEEGSEEASATATAHDASRDAEALDASSGESSATPTAENRREAEPQVVTKNGSGVVLSAVRPTETEEDPVPAESRSSGTATGGSIDDAEALDSDSPQTDSEQTEAEVETRQNSDAETKTHQNAETTPSATKRFLDKAKELVDRGND